VSKLPEFIISAADYLQKVKSFRYYDYFLSSGRYFDSKLLSNGFSLIYAGSKLEIHLSKGNKKDEISLKKGELFILPKVYSVKIKGSSLDFFKMTLSDHYLTFSNKAQTYRFECHPISVNSHHLFNLFTDFQESYKKAGEISEFRTRSLLNLLIADLLDMADGHRSASFEKGKSRESYNKLIMYTYGNYHKSIDASQISADLGLSVQYLNSLANEFRRMSLKELVNFYRLEKSREKLLESSSPVADVALACGFKGAAYFIKLFRMTYGITPLQCRKKLLHKKTKFDKEFHEVKDFLEVEAQENLPENIVIDQEKVTMVIINSSKRTVAFSWYDPAEPEVEMYRLHPGQRVHVGTGCGECWCAREDSGELIAYYHVPNECCQIII